MAKPPSFGLRLDPTSAEYEKLLKLSGRIAALLEFADAQKDKYLRDTLDLFLGAVYALVLAKYGTYDHRPKPTQPDKILIRARDVESGWIRLDGKWMSGFHFNSALFRISSVYHRSLKIAASRLVGQEEGETTRRCRESRRGVRELEQRERAGPVHVEVTESQASTRRASRQEESDAHPGASRLRGNS